MNLLLVFLLAITSTYVTISDASGHSRKLDRRYKNISHPIEDTQASETHRTKNSRSDTEALIRLQTSIKDQGKRGSCSIFSSTAYLESMLVIHKQADTNVDLSEEWLAYLATRDKTDDGSEAYINLHTFLKYGFTTEDLMPYVTEDWRETESDLENARCGHLSGDRKIKCIVNHWDPLLLFRPDSDLLSRASEFYAPDFLKARQNAFANRDRVLKNISSEYTEDYSDKFKVTRVSEVKKTLRSGQPVLLEFDYYYAAWNDKEAPDHGLISDHAHYLKGIVGYPEKNSLDREVSLSDKLGVGHSILVIGYDDSVEVTTEQVMKNGSVKKFTYKGVYYFKNSWGADDFGKDFEINGNGYPGYGMMVQKHAHELGGFYKLNW